MKDECRQATSFDRFSIAVVYLFRPMIQHVLVSTDFLSFPSFSSNQSFSTTPTPTYTLLEHYLF